jgi:hypothetical protein
VMHVVQDSFDLRIEEPMDPDDLDDGRVVA